MTTSTKRLAASYDALAADERASLIFEAAARDDDVELDRLISTAPTDHYSVHHSYTRCLAFQILSLEFFIEQLCRYHLFQTYHDANWFLLSDTRNICRVTIPDFFRI